jgi:manganese/zinc/iron transport system substrate-binding protein
MFRSVVAIAALLLVMCFQIGCTGSDSGAKQNVDGLISIVATTAMIADAAATIGGEYVDVSALMGPGSDPHLYNATAGDVSRMRDANLILYNGLHLEGKLDDVLEAVGKSKPVVAVAERIPEERRLRSSLDSQTYDPHVWFDVSRWMFVLDAIEDALIEIDAEHRETYVSNAAAYRDSLTALDAWIHQTLAVVPDNRRALITAHDAFAYFADAYGFEVHGLQGISTVSEAGTGDMRRIANLIADRDIPAIFVESSVPTKSIEAVQASVRSKGKSVAIGGELFSDAMGLPGTQEGTYVGMVRHNVNTITSSLAPEAAMTSFGSLHEAN